jgi:2'-deoxynucleoside 5'-phosphate N-hydrolase
MNILHQPKVYISGALTGIDQPTLIKGFYESVGLLCQKIGFQAYVPHINTDPIDHPNISPYQVFDNDKREVSNSDLVIAYVGYPSIGVGMELAYAETNAIPIILLYEKEKIVSRFPRGIPTVISQVEFTNYQDALTQLESTVETLHATSLHYLLGAAS